MRRLTGGRLAVRAGSGVRGRVKHCAGAAPRALAGRRGGPRLSAARSPPKPSARRLAPCLLSWCGRRGSGVFCLAVRLAPRRPARRARVPPRAMQASPCCLSHLPRRCRLSQGEAGNEGKAGVGSLLQSAVECHAERSSDSVSGVGRGAPTSLPRAAPLEQPVCSAGGGVCKLEDGGGDARRAVAQLALRDSRRGSAATR